MKTNIRECPVCMSLYAIQKWHVQFRDREFDYILCKSYGMIYLSPLPLLSKVLTAYHEELPEYFYQEDYFSFLERFGEKVGPPTRVIRLIEHFLPNGPSENIFALDVGAGSRGLLRSMRNEFDWQVEGIEPTPFSKHAAKKI